MNRILSCVIILFLSSNLSAQQFNTTVANKEETTTLFDYGQPLHTTEANFKNLFKNFPLLISNSSDRLKLISYEFVTSIKNEKQIRFYVDKNTKFYNCGAGIVSALGSTDVENNNIKLVFPSKSLPKKPIDKVQLKEINNNIEKITDSIHLGDEVYVVKLMAEGTTYDCYVFVNPETKRVHKFGSYFGFDIPRYYADFHSKRKAD